MWKEYIVITEKLDKLKRSNQQPTDNQGKDSLQWLGILIILYSVSELLQISVSNYLSRRQKRQEANGEAVRQIQTLERCALHQTANTSGDSRKRGVSKLEQAAIIIRKHKAPATYCHTENPTNSQNIQVQDNTEHYRHIFHMLHILSYSHTNPSPLIRFWSIMTVTFPIYESFLKTS